MKFLLKARSSELNHPRHCCSYYFQKIQTFLPVAGCVMILYYYIKLQGIPKTETLPSRKQETQHDN